MTTQIKLSELMLSVGKISNMSLLFLQDASRCRSNAQAGRAIKHKHQTGNSEFVSDLQVLKILDLSITVFQR